MIDEVWNWPENSERFWYNHPVLWTTVQPCYRQRSGTALQCCCFGVLLIDGETVDLTEDRIDLLQRCGRFSPVEDLLSFVYYSFDRSPWMIRTRLYIDATHWLSSARPDMPRGLRLPQQRLGRCLRPDCWSRYFLPRHWPRNPATDNLTFGTIRSFFFLSVTSVLSCVGFFPHNSRNHYHKAITLSRVPAIIAKSSNPIISQVILL